MRSRPCPIHGGWQNFLRGLISSTFRFVSNVLKTRFRENTQTVILILIRTRVRAISVALFLISAEFDLINISGFQRCVDEFRPVDRWNEAERETALIKYANKDPTTARHIIVVGRQLVDGYLLVKRRSST